MKILTYEEAINEYYQENVSETVIKKMIYQTQRDGAVFLEFRVTNWKKRININEFFMKFLKKFQLANDGLKFKFSPIINTYNNKFLIQVYVDKEKKENIHFVKKIEEYLEKQN